MDVKRICPGCQKPLAPDGPLGLCPECLIKSGFPSGADTETESGRQSAFVPPAVEELARLFPQLEILGLIGKGGMGAVYKARQKQLNRLVALKILPRGIGPDAAFAERFTREAQALAQLNHPGIVTLYEFGETDGQFYFLMEFVDGVNLRQLLASSRVAPREALAIVPQICDALQFAHDQGIVHRDIKPENILLDRRGRVKVADFGLAKLMGTGEEPAAGSVAAGPTSLTDAGKVMGTPNYMSPEQKKNPGEVDHRADIYALGVVVYQMLTGELPGKQLQPPSAKVQIDVRLDEIVLRAMEKKPELRYQQASAFKTQIESIAAEAEQSKVQGPKSKVSRKTMIAAVVLVVIFAVLAPNYISSSWTWAPKLAAGQKPDFQKILDDAKDMTSRGQYEESLQRHLWFHKHGPEFGDSYQNIVRITSALKDWVELGQRYPKAKKALLKIRDQDARALAQGQGYAEQFTDVQAINRELQDEEATYALFKTIREKQPKLAAQCYFWVEGLLAAKGEYQWCYDYMGDPQQRFDTLRRSFDMGRQSQQRMSELYARAPLPQIPARIQPPGAAMVPANPPPDPSTMMKKSTEDRFIGQARQLIEILVGTGHKDEVEKIRDQAVAVIDDVRLRSAVSDAEKKIGKSDPPPASASVEDEALQLIAGQPPVVVETFPVSGADDVAPGELEIRVRFSKPMAGGRWSWNAVWPDSMPEMIGQPHYEADHKTCVLKVRLQPGTTCGYWLNSEQYNDFKDLAGQPAVPYLLTFKTKPK